ncbi:MAG: hypothetical protein A2169_05960 [Deltaproteobacteria bacterium RBG_13_47_9]|nr:MAG: hypothetical protein A2169_05960 [Deltaproteobacteria bacterium RBG_13_47_9]
MRYQRRFLGLAILLLCVASFSYGEDYDLQYFLSKSSSKTRELSKNERAELFDRIDGVIGRAQRIRMKLVEGIQTGETDIRYQDGKFWISKLENDQESIETAIRQIKLLKEKPTHLVAAINLFKSLKDLSSNFNAYNNMPSFSAFVGDLAPEIELWADPVFYKLFLMPLARLKDLEKEPPRKEKKPISKGKKP